MAFIDGAGTGVLRGLRFTGRGAVGEIAVVPLSPEHNGVSETGHLFFRVDITSAVDADVDIEVSSDDTFTTTDWSTTLVTLSSGNYNVLPTGLTPGTTYYWRMRAGEAGSGVFGDWVLYGDPGVPWSFVYGPGRSEAHEYTYINLGALDIPSPDAHEYVYLNAGFELVLSPDGGEYIYLNVGFEVTLNQDEHSYIYLGDIDESTPHPHIWWLYPAGGREGDGIKIVGYGFGHTQVEYDGVVEIDWGGTLGWQPIAHVSWQTIVAGSDAYTEDRRISEFLNLSDPEHQIVEIIVPPDAIPPGYPIRIRTDGP